METTAQFDLNKAVRLWREKLANAPAITCDAVNELEMHLRDSVATLEEKGLTTAEAFWVASQRLGSSESLEKEFSKVNAERVWIDRLSWMLIGAISVKAIFSFAFAFTSVATTGMYALTRQTMILGPFSLILFFALLALLLAFFWFAGRHSESWLCHLGRSLKKTPVKTALIAMALVTLTGAASNGAQMLSAYTMPVEALTTSLYWTAVPSSLFSFLAPAILGWVLMRARRTETVQ